MKKSMLFEAVMVLLLITLVFIIYVMVTTGGPSGQWAVSNVIGSQDGYAYGNIIPGDNGMVYAIDGKNIRAIGPEGNIMWNVTIPNVLYGTSVESWRGMKAVTDNGTLYIVFMPTDYSNRGELAAISKNGTLLWGKAYSPGDFPADLSLTNGYLYAIYPGRVVVYDLAGNEVWHETEVYNMPAVDENGTVYMLKGSTGMMLVAGAQNGGYLWNKDISSYGLGPMLTYNFWQPFYNDHTIYLILQGGVVALDQDGNLKWKKPCYNVQVFYSSGDMGGSFDKNGNLYLRNGQRIFYLSPDGSEHTVTDNFDVSQNGMADISNGIMYIEQTVSALTGNVIEYPDYTNHYIIEDAMNGTLPQGMKAPDNRTLDQLDTEKVSAYDLMTGRLLWNYTLPVDSHTTTLTRSNYMSVIGQSIDFGYIEQDNAVSSAEWYRSRNVTEGAKLINSISYAEPMLSGDRLYVNFWSDNYEVPTFFGESKCTYAGGIYALDKNGSLLWSQEPGSRVTVMDQKNGTVYFGTNDGSMFATRADVAAGFALTAAAYLFIRFLMAGAVTRARSRIDSNENRNSVLKFIIKYPGSSLYELSRGLKMNKGTVRYHLLILGINHRITSYRSDDKYVRYFKNSGAYSTEEQLAYSVVRRSGIKKVLSTLLAKPNLSNLELSKELGMQESATLRYAKELVEKGIVSRDQASDGRLSYSIKNEYKEPVAFAMERLNSP